MRELNSFEFAVVAGGEGDGGGCTGDGGGCSASGGEGGGYGGGANDYGYDFDGAWYSSSDTARLGCDILGVIAGVNLGKYGPLAAGLGGLATKELCEAAVDYFYAYYDGTDNFALGPTFSADYLMGH